MTPTGSTSELVSRRYTDISQLPSLDKFTSEEALDSPLSETTSEERSTEVSDHPTTREELERSSDTA